MNGKLVMHTAFFILGSFVAALLIAECRQVRQTHDAVIRLEEKQKK
jgi:hypothetical protein